MNILESILAAGFPVVAILVAGAVMSYVSALKHARLSRRDREWLPRTRP